MTAINEWDDDGMEVIEDGFGGAWVNCHVRCSQEVVRPGKVQCQGLYVPADTESGEYEDAVDEDGRTIFAPCPWGNTPHLEGHQNGSEDNPHESDGTPPEACSYCGDVWPCRGSQSGSDRGGE